MYNISEAVSKFVFTYIYIYVCVCVCVCMCVCVCVCVCVYRIHTKAAQKVLSFTEKEESFLDIFVGTTDYHCL